MAYSPSTIDATERDALLPSGSSQSHCDIASSKSDIRKRSTLLWILFGLWSAVFLGALDGTVVATLLSPIGNYFRESNKSSYLGTSYLLSVCCFTPLYGRISDIIGRKSAMLVALTFFTTGTLLCGIASSMNMLIVARAIAGMVRVSNIAVTDLVPLRQRGLYQGLANILFGLGAGLGGPLGGLISDTLGWRWTFLFQVPPLILSMSIVAAKVNIPLSAEMRSQSTREKLRRVDWMGSLTLVLGVGCLLLSLSLKTSEDIPWSSPLIWGMLIMSVVFIALFILVEAKWSVAPVMPMRLLAQRTPLAVAIANFLVSILGFGMMFNVPLYFSAVRMVSSSEAGSHLIPGSIAGSIGSLFAGWMIRHTGKYYRITLVSALLGVLSCTLVSLWNENTPSLDLWFDIAPNSFAVGSVLTTTLIAMITSVSREDMAVATGITYLFRTSGQVLAVSLSGALIQAVLTRRLSESITGPGASEVWIISRIRHETDYITQLPSPLREAAVRSYASAIKAAFICQTVAAVLLFISCLPIQENSLP
ncbi:MFS general substrate transporter [Hysterangium stoloniferum]|nr:MFS general substrate transporter [Hysterangium stoloniferum]